MSSFTLQTSTGPRFSIYAWPEDEKRNTAEVFVGISFYPLSTNSVISPDEARALANHLLAAANIAEGIEDTGRTQAIIKAFIGSMGPQDLEAITAEVSRQGTGHENIPQAIAALEASGLIKNFNEPGEPPAWETT